MPIVACRKCGTRNRVEVSLTEKLQPKCGKCGAPLDIANIKADESGRPLVVTDATFGPKVLEVRDRPVLVDAWAPWCAPCRMIAPVLDQLAAEANGAYLIAKLNVDENPAIANQFRIQSIPTLLIFKNGKLMDRLIGVQPKQTIATKLANIP